MTMTGVRMEEEQVPSTALNDVHDPAAPVIYADQLMGITYGPFVARMIFGVDDNVNKTRTSVATVVMPMSMMHNVIAGLAQQLANPAVSAKFKAEYDNYLNSAVFQTK
jgi:hypothetical protein